MRLLDLHYCSAGRRHLRRAVTVVAASAQPGVDASSSSTSTSSSSSTATVPSNKFSSSAPSIIKIPSSIHEVDNGKILGFGAELSEDHPVRALPKCSSWQLLPRLNRGAAQADACRIWICSTHVHMALLQQHQQCQQLLQLDKASKFFSSMLSR
jgi:hypothetical protein